jgi:hypothetical protein
MNDEIRLGVLIPIAQAQWSEKGGARELIDFAVRAERLGYDSLWVNDSLLSPRVEALTMLAAAAIIRLPPVHAGGSLGAHRPMPAMPAERKGGPLMSTPVARLTLRALTADCLRSTTRARLCPRRPRLQGPRQKPPREAAF